MKSFIYDPITLRFTAELDENNFATFYDYDEQGQLIRIRKETDRGIMTIKESRTSLKQN
jgi:YD repeat-containing protein